MSDSESSEQDETHETHTAARPPRIPKKCQHDDLEAMIEETERIMDARARTSNNASLAAHPMRFRTENPLPVFSPKQRRDVRKPRKPHILQLAKHAHHEQIKAFLKREQCNLPASTKRHLCDVIEQRCIRANARTEKKTLAVKQRLAELQREEGKHKSIIAKHEQFLRIIMAEAIDVGSNDIAEELLPVIVALDALRL